MHFLCKCKISIHSSTPLHEYPIIRLPREFKALVGEMANIYMTENTDKFAFNIIINKKVDKVCANSERSHDENRLAALESQIAQLKSLILQYASESDAENRKQKAEGEIRTRVVASTGP